MRACSCLNVIAGSVVVALLSFAACGGGQTPAALPESPSGSAALLDAGPPVSGPNEAPTPLAIAPVDAGKEPDRNMNDIRAVVAGNRDVFRACYEQSAKSHPGIKGTFTMRFIVNPDGSVKSAEADPAKSEIHAADLEACAANALKHLKFPPSRRGMESSVSYPFDFNPKAPPKTMPAAR